jgi:hypothetical protein
MQQDRDGLGDDQGTRIGEPDSAPSDERDSTGRETKRGQHAARSVDAGAEATPDDISDHTTEHESGYGGKQEQPRVSSDQRPGT